MKYLGIDIGKENHTAALIDETGEQLFKPFLFTNSTKGYAKLMQKLTKIEKDTIVIGMEATGHYWLNLYEKLHTDDYFITVLNPIQVKAFRNQGVRGSKTDLLDAELIAKVLRFGQTIETNMTEDAILSLRNLTRYRSDLSEHMAKLKNKAISLLDQIFPEFSRLFSKTFGTAALAILKEAPTPDEILGLDNDKLLKIISQASQGRLGLKKAQQLKEAAQTSFGLKIAADSFAFQMKLMISEINHLKDTLKTLEKEIEKYYIKLNVKLTTIPGIGVINAAAIIAEIGDINKFQNKKGGATALVAFAGMDPKLKESGKWSGRVKMSKRGNRYLRKAIYSSSFCCLKWDEFFRNIYDKQRKKGKAHTVAVNYVGTKMLHVIYRILKDKRDYIPMQKD